MVAKKLYYTMGEVAEMFDVNASLIRHWESKFSCLRPHKNKKGNRLFSPEDIERLKQIYHLVKERGMTLEGANKVMRASAKTADLSRDTEMLERLQRILAALVEVREELKLGVGEQIVSSEVEDSPVEVEQKTTVQPVAEPINEPKVEPVTEPATEPQAATEAEQDSEPKSEQPKKRVVRRKKKSDDDNKELFPFYE
ncbi:MAG: MerR family transcriptional regulator, partial [Alistipes sp.]|nr:MerR family transcriptional regulator [Alistipes sp.]